MKQTLFIIDGSSFLYRAYYGLKPLHTSEGVPVHAVYGFCRMFKKLVETHTIQACVLVWDMPGKTARHERFPAYKATRQAPPDDLFTQKELIQEFAQLITLAQIGIGGIEADDIIFSIAHEAVNHNCEVVIVSSDKDLAQCLAPHIRQFDPLKLKMLDVHEYTTAHGFSPKESIFFHALVGDASDNIPGAPGIGPKTATKLVQEFKTVDNLYQQITNLSPKLQNILTHYKSDILLSYDLFELKNIPLSIDFRSYQFNASSFLQATPLFTRLEFTSMLPNQPSNKKQEPNTAEIESLITYWKHKQITIVNTIETLHHMLTIITESSMCAIDTETTGCNTMHARMIGFSCSVGNNQTWYIPLNATLNRDEILIACKPWLENSTYKKCMHNAKYDLMIFANEHIIVQGVNYDTMIMARLLLPEWNKVGLKNLSQLLLDETMLSFEQIIQYAKVDSFDQVPLDLATLYAGADALQTYQLFKLLYAKLEKEQLHSLYRTIEHPTMLLLVQMERTGITVNKTTLEDLNQSYQKQLKTVEEQIAHEGNFIPGSINLNSPKQIEYLLFNTLQLPPQKKSAKKTGFSTDVSVLEKLAPLHKVPQLLLLHRELNKLQQTYTEALLTYIDTKTSKIYTHFNQTIVATGRLSSTEPNLQNIPRSGIGKEIRKAFIAQPGNALISADYSQVELRVLAHISQDTTLINAFNQGKDIHAKTAAGLFQIPIEKVNEEQRQLGKKINFSILYGKTPFGLAQELHISVHEAKAYIDTFFTHYPMVKEWMNQALTQATHNGFSTTAFGRRRFFEHLASNNASLRQQAQRAAINSIIQGTAADIMKIGMCKVAEQLKETPYHIMLQIHDEIIIEGPSDTIKSIEPIIINSLESAVHNWAIPLSIGITIGKNWYEIS